ncbi:helix-turn-helix transcriptional regulator [Flavonifractor sp. An100]|uniref:helix-turn-helix domain-containing protein n=1 Tax=Flavonifractor sp. An100 TaxID=1965538 RepID=UPI000B37C7EF|nr:helix-turn-helix transcriptional regulator [Flavonifractor sp. An100]OUQ82416.1 transcriptional regulator [Flavonifractor sp. An100]
MKIYDYDGAKNISGERIRQARVTQRLTQGDLAARMQLNGVQIEREAISKIESGVRFVADYELVHFSKVLGVAINWLVGEE